MRRVADLLDALERLAPSGCAEEWDNVGLLVGGREGALCAVGVVLDATEDAVQGAAAKGCGALVAHHPLVFAPLRSVTLESPIGRTIARSLALGVAVVAAHTNWDRAPGGVNASLASLLELDDVVPLIPDVRGIAWGDGAIGNLSRSMDTRTFTAFLRDALGLSWTQSYTARSDAAVRRVAIVGGSGGSFWGAARRAGADILVTADVKYHERLDALASGISLCAVDHGEMERASLPRLAERLGAELDLPIHLLPSAASPRLEEECHA